MATTRRTTAKSAGKTARKATTKTAKSAAGATGKATSAAGAKRTMTMPSFADLGKLVGNFKMPGVDVKAIVESQRKDMEALAEANRQAYEGIKALAKRRNEILQEALGEWQAAMKDATGKDAMSKNAERAKQGVKQAIDRFRELAEMEAETRRKSWKVLQDRFQENLQNLQNVLKAK
ncbi:MAG TPA: phasin family protein [Caldimonas sp.]|jgi:phasin family protein|nr:phasin family protein [Caldimonas sp.]